MSADILRDLARAKVAFQLRTIETIIRGPASVDTHPQGGNSPQSEVPFMGSAVPAGEQGDAQSLGGQQP